MYSDEKFNEQLQKIIKKLESSMEYNNNMVNHFKNLLNSLVGLDKIMDFKEDLAEISRIVI